MKKACEAYKEGDLYFDARSGLWTRLSYPLSPCPSVFDRIVAIATPIFLIGIGILLIRMGLIVLLVGWPK